MLKACNMVLKFGGLIAVNNISLDVKPGKITGLIGPNGAGKTTTFNCLSGVYALNSGEVFFEGNKISGKRCYQICDAGISRTYQVINLFRNMTVLENVMIGMHCRLKTNFFGSLLHTKRMRAEECQVREKAYELLRFVDLEAKANDQAGSLSYGEQRLLEIARGLASDPKLMLLDEPAAGMNTTEKAELDAVLQRILARGTTILMIEHDMKLVMDVCDYIYVMEQGKLLAEGTPAEVQNNPEVIRAYLGGE